MDRAVHVPVSLIRRKKIGSEPLEVPDPMLNRRPSKKSPNL
jgi:hypothetical protein